MDFQLKYANELDKLKENEDYIEFFRDTAINQMRDNLEELKKTIDGLLIFSKENNLYRAKAWAYYYLGWYNFDSSHYDKALDDFLISNDVFEQAGDKTGIIYACNGLTNVYCQIGQFKLANEWGLKGISLCEETDNKDALVILLINTGINYIQMNYFDKAREIFKSIEMMDCDLTNRQQVSCKLSLAEVEINIGDPNTALSYIETAWGIEEQSHINKDISEIYKLKGMAYIKLGEYDIAEKEFIKSYDFSNEQGLIYEKCCAMVEWSKLCILVGRKQDAIGALNEVTDICQSKELNVLTRETYYTLYKIYKELNSASEALSYLEKYILIDDKMYDYEQNQLMAKMNVKHTKREADQYKSLYSKTELLSTIGQKIISNLEINSIIEIINEEINKLLEADYFGIAVYDNEKDQATYCFVGENKAYDKVVQFNESENTTFGEYCIKNKKDIIVDNKENEYRKYITAYPRSIINTDGKELTSMIYTPMIINDKVVGLMTVQSYKENAYDKNDLHTLKILANYSAIAIENAISYKKIEDIATYDHVTGFLTKCEIIKLGNVTYEQYKNSQLKFSVAMMDIDNFKKINDTYGHVYGDKALSLVAETIAKCIRNTDYIGRYGGDEFLLICPDLEKHEAADVADRIRTSIENKTFSLGDGIAVKLTISMGLHEYDLNDKSFTDAVKKADKCLYKAKESDKNIVIFQSYN